jgi:hypothetical protein
MFRRDKNGLQNIGMNYLMVDHIKRANLGTAWIVFILKNGFNKCNPKSGNVFY